MAASKRPRLGDALIRSGLLTSERLDYALAQQKKTNERLGQVLIKLNPLADENLREALAVQLDIPYMNLDSLTLNKKTSAKSSTAATQAPQPRTVRRWAKRSRYLSSPRSGRSSKTEPLDRPARDGRDRVTRSNHARAGSVVRDGQSRHPRTGPSFGAGGNAQSSSPKCPPTPERANTRTSTGKTKTADVIVRTLLTLAIQHRASDIHIEMLGEPLEIRYESTASWNSSISADLKRPATRAREVVSRLKILGKLDIAEKRRPQDGSFRVKVERRGARRRGSANLHRAGLLRRKHGRPRPQSFQCPHITRAAATSGTGRREAPAVARASAGIILVTCPTGSGKSTTLYASLMTVYRPTALQPSSPPRIQSSPSAINSANRRSTRRSATRSPTICSRSTSTRSRSDHGR